MDEADHEPAGDERGLRRDDPLEQRAQGFSASRRRGNGVRSHGRRAGAAPSSSPRGEILERADADMAGRDAGQHGARQHASRDGRAPRRHGGQRARGRDAERRHRLADDVFAQDRAQRGAPVAAAREGSPPGALELDVDARAVRADDLAQQDGAAVAELRDEMAELVAGIGERDRGRAVGDAIAGEQLCAFGAGERVGIEAESSANARLTYQALARRPAWERSARRSGSGRRA